MLTLKVITTDADGHDQTNLFSADSISHSEGIEKQSGIKAYGDVELLGAPPMSSSEQEFVACHVWLYNVDRTVKWRLLILPYSQCYIMDSGKTVDSFISAFK